MSWFSHQDRGGDDREIDQLQADVMRFMAILGLILTVIFALVQSLPFHSAVASPEQERIIELQARLARLREQIQNTQDRLRQIKENIHKADSIRQQVFTQIGILTSQRKAAIQELNRLDVQVQESKEAVDALEQKTLDRRFSLFTVQNRTIREQQRLQKLQQRVANLEKQARQVMTRHPAKSVAKTATTPPPKKNEIPRKSKRIPVKQPRQLGFSLKFASDKALDRLVSRGDIQFFVISQGRAWQVRLGNAGPQFVSVHPPGEFHEMAADTVPEKYRQGFQRYKISDPANRQTWAVVLPPRITRAVQALIKGRTGGNIIIKADTSVAFQ